MDIIAYQGMNVTGNNSTVFHCASGLSIHDAVNMLKGMTIFNHGFNDRGESAVYDMRATNGKDSEHQTGRCKRKETTKGEKKDEIDYSGKRVCDHF